MSATSGVQLPYAPRDACRFGIREALIYDGLGRLAKATGMWRYPARASGDLQDMQLLDKVYWVYKGSHPIRRAERGSGLEEFFARQTDVGLPPCDWEGRVTLSAVGDLMNHPFLATSTHLYDDVASLVFGVDLAMANLECVVIDPAPVLEIDIGSRAGPPLAMSMPAFAAATTGGGRRFDFLATACNHSIDFGELGVASTIRAVRDAGIAFHGINEDEADAERATLVERNGVRIAIVSHTFGVNAHPKPAHRPRIVNHTRLNLPVDMLDLGVLESQLAHALVAGADFIVAQLHWGMEFEFYPRTTQLDVAHRIAEAGADLIIGHHPHVMQPVEFYRTRRDPDRVVPIYYSLGNLTTPFAIDYMRKSGVARVELARGKTRNGVRKTYVARSALHTVEQCVSGSELRLRTAS